MKKAAHQFLALNGTDEIQHPRGETLPERGVSDGRPHLLEDDKKNAAPERGAMNLSRGPQVVSSQQQQECVVAHLACLEIPPPRWNRPADKGRVGNHDRGNQHEPLMR